MMRNSLASIALDSSMLSLRQTGQRKSADNARARTSRFVFDNTSSGSTAQAVVPNNQIIIAKRIMLQLQ